MAFISIEQNGEIHRCIRLKENLGHVATGVQLYKMPQPCPITRCPCWGQYLLVDREKVQKTAAAFVIPTAAVLVSTPISGRMDLFVHAASHSWRTGVERTSPSHAHEFFHDESTWLLGLRYWFSTQSAVKPYLHLMVGKYFDTIHYHTTTYNAPFYGLAAEHTSTSRENGSDTGLGFGVAFLIMSHLFCDMSITSHAATQLNSHVVLLAGLSYHIGF